MDRIRRRDLFPLPLLAFTATSARAADCEALVSAIQRVEEHIDGIDAWVLTDGPNLVAMLEGQLASQKAKLQQTTALYSAAERKEGFAALGLASSLALMIAGVVLPPTLSVIVPLYVVGLAISQTLVIAELSTDPKSFDAVEYAVIKGASDVQLVLESAAARDTVASFKRVTGRGAGLIGLVLLFKDFRELGDAAVAADAIDAFRKKLLAQVEAAEADLQKLKQSADLRGYRLAELQALKERLEANLDICLSSPTLPTAP